MPIKKKSLFEASNRKQKKSFHFEFSKIRTALISR